MIGLVLYGALGAAIAAVRLLSPRPYRSRYCGPPMPPDDVLEAEWRCKRAVANYLARQVERVPYQRTHGPWDMREASCLTCGKSEIAIHANRLRCLPSPRDGGPEQ